jgi:5-methylcytosine-specific restriction endonuclease McrA
MPSLPKIGRIRLKPAAYKALCEQVLERDGWTCRRCSERQNLQVHHIIKRSFCRIDTSWNLVSLCNVCHEMVERHKVVVVGSNADILPPHAGAISFRPEPPAP